MLRYIKHLRYLAGSVPLLIICLSARAAAPPIAKFEDVAVIPGVLTTSTSTLVSGDFSFSPSTGGLHGVENGTGFGASNGSNYLFFQTDPTTSETFRLTNGGYFNLMQIDIGGWFNFGSVTPKTLTVTGTTATGTVTAIVTLSPTAFTTFTGSQLIGFTQLQSVTLGNVAGISYVALDNVNYVPATAPVPEPETYVLLLTGLGLMGWSTRRRVNKA